MKIISILVIYLLIFSFLSGCTIQDKKTIKVSGAFALYPMMNIWAEEYKKIKPDVKIEVSAGGAGKGMSDAILGIVDIGMVSRDIYQEEINQGIFWISVAKDAVVATINTNNPVIEKILLNGLTRQQFEEIFIKRNITTWGQLIGNPTIKDNIRVYTRSDACGAAETWALYLGDYNQDDLTNVADSAINGDPNLAAAIQGDRLGIGFNNINFVYDSTTKKPFEGIKPVPINLNENGFLNENERFYDTRDDIVNSIANEIYPSPPARALHLVTKNNFTDITKDFIYWILTEGQKYVSTSGYIELSEETISEQIIYLERGER
ncbi:phosphate ABC transporter substrate-binding protein [Thermoplasmatales archaeon SG8-52-1]|nr:MAG: phosphate ABC transporter substrate-binding protein [Thermoplasmatales archaeon SG8-52-1]